MVRHKETSCHQAYILRVCILAWVRIGGPWRAHITWLSFGAPNITLRLIFGSLLKSSKDPRTKSMKPRSDIHRVTSKSCFSGQRTFSHFIDNKALMGALPVPNGNNWKTIGGQSNQMRSRLPWMPGTFCKARVELEWNKRSYNWNQLLFVVNYLGWKYSKNSANNSNPTALVLFCVQ